MTNTSFARVLIEELLKLGVAEFCVCAGQRSSPLVLTLDATKNIRTFHFFEERSAAFFALGRAKSSRRPVAVVTTSGTAAAELLPASIEAFYSGVPLALVTADRPRRFRGTGAPQCIEQVGLFSPYVSCSVDLEAGEEIPLSTWRGDAPLHLNVCFDEPLLDAAVQTAEAKAQSLRRAEVPKADPRLLQSFLASVHRPLVILGAIDREDRKTVLDLLVQLQCPVYAEAPSGLRESPELSSLRLTSGETILQKDWYDSVIRLGSVPTTRLWRDLETKKKHLPVLSMSSLPFSGLSRKSTFLHTSLSALADINGFPNFSGRFAEVFDVDAKAQEKLITLFRDEPHAEPSLVHALSQKIPKNSLVYLGNSLPIREWDLAATFEDRGFHIAANRGANGIDGQLSTFFGMCEPNRENWAIVGDLTALYDLSAPWIVKDLKNISVKIVIINNGGGKIFANISDNPILQNRHSIHFKAWADWWGIDLLELVPNAEASERFWKCYSECSILSN